MKSFGELNVHSRYHPLFGHKFNPYSGRIASHRIDKKTFYALCDIYREEDGISCIDFLFAGSIDAPDVIPGGSSERINTVGGWEREEYTSTRRGCDCWKASALAEARAAELIKELLADLK